MTIGSLTPLHSLTPLQQARPLRECFSIDDVRTLVSKQLGVDLEFVTSKTHFTNDLGADLLDRVELMLAIEAKFAGVKITDDDLEQIQVVGDLIRHLNTKQVKR
jgi:acyl carrier protein